MTYILSNNHVLSLANQLAIGTNIVQPSIQDGGVAPTTTSVNDLVATLSNFIPIDFGTFTITIFGITYTLPRVNYVDCALAIVRDAFNGANREIHWVGYPATSTVDPTQFSFFGLNLIFPSQVCKMGRTTEYTVGNIVDISWDGYIDYSPMFGNVNGTNRAWFQDQLKIDGGRRPFSMPGDSGSGYVFIRLTTCWLIICRCGKFFILQLYQCCDESTTYPADIVSKYQVIS